MTRFKVGDYVYDNGFSDGRFKGEIGIVREVTNNEYYIHWFVINRLTKVATTEHHIKLSDNRFKKITEEEVMLEML